MITKLKNTLARAFAGFFIFLTACASPSPTVTESVVYPTRSASSDITASEPSAPQASTIVAEQQEVILSLENNATLVVGEGSLEPGSTVSFRIVPEEDWNVTQPQDIEIDQIYEVDAESWNADLEASLTLPIDTQGLTDEEIELTYLAYYQDGQWVAVPSTIDREAGTITATVNHFSIWAVFRRLFNTPPLVVVEVEPQIYTGARPQQRGTEVDLDDLNIHIHATDPDGQPVEVQVAVGLETVGSWAIDALNRKRAEEGNLYLLETLSEQFTEPISSTLIETTGQIALSPTFVLGTVVKQQLAPEVSQDLTILDWYELNEVSPGHYLWGYRLRGQSFESPLKALHVYVRVSDDIAVPIELDIEVPITEDTPPHPPQLTTPRNSVTIVCPPTPTFNWYFERPEPVASYTFRLAEGSDPWTRNVVERWIRRSGDDGFTERTWTPSGPLPDGVYSWSMAASGNPMEQDFSDARTTPHSDTYVFTVDSALTGTECLEEKDTLLPLWLELVVDGTRVGYSERYGERQNYSLRWVVYENDELLLSKRVEGINAIDLAQFIAPPDEDMTLHIYIEAVPNEEPEAPPQRVSEPVTVTIPALVVEEEATEETDSGMRANAYVNSDVLNFRTGPGYGFPVLEILQKGDPLYLLETSWDNAWARARIRDGREGWVLIRLLDLRVDIADVPFAEIIPEPPPSSSGLADVDVSQRNITLSVYDHGSVDGDIISLTVNGTTVLSHYTLTGGRHDVSVTLNRGLNQIELIAHNEGRSSPNTVSLHISHVISGIPDQVSLGMTTGQRDNFRIRAP
jgi:hypothetical protein